MARVSFIQKMLNVDALSLRSFCLLAALVLYAVLGSPTPNYPGVVEALVAGLLVCAVGLSGAIGALQFDRAAPLWRSAGQALLLYGVSMAIVMGLVRGNDTGLMLRDIFPFFFMMMPVLLYGLYQAYPASFKYVLAGTLVIGGVFSLRALEDVGGSVLSMFMQLDRGELTYLANMPTVLFAALFAFGCGAQKFMRDFTLRAAAAFVVLAGAAAMLLLPLALTTQRASLGYAGLYVVLILGWGFYKYPYRAGVILIALGIVAAPMMGILGELAGSLAQKTSLVGANARFEELAAVWAEISRSGVTAVFGAGWGGTFESPAVAEIRVNFSHSLLSSMMLKMGVFGLGLVILYLAGLAMAGLRVLKINSVLALALAGPIVIDVFLYASFKSLDFGLMLLLVTSGVATLQKSHPAAIQERSNLTSVE